MANMLEDGAGFLADELKNRCSVSVVIQAGNLEVTVKAVKGRSELKVDDGAGGIRIVTTDRDYMVQMADLVLAGVATLPEKGWRIREAVGSAVEVYEALSPAKGKDVFSWCDEFKKALRIHCKLAAKEF